MAETFIPIRSVKGYFKEFGIEAIGKKHADPALVKEQILDAFRKEIFGQLVMKFGDVEILARDIDTVDPETKKQVDNILRNILLKFCIYILVYISCKNIVQIYSHIFYFLGKGKEKLIQSFIFI